MKRFVANYWWLGIFSVYVVLFVSFEHYQFPEIGHDFHFWFERLLAGNWHFSKQGMSPFLYTPFLCGGIPIYAGPHDIYFSISQLLSLHFNPWIAIHSSIILFLCIGYFGSFQFGKKVLQMNNSWSHVLAIAIISNGFHIMHSSVGHFQMHTVPALMVMLYLVFERKEENALNFFMRCCIFGLIFAYLIHASGYLTIIYFVFTVVILIPIFLISELNNAYKISLLLRLSVSVFIGLLICISKLIAVYSFMKFFPRHAEYPVIDSALSTAIYVIKSFWFIPQHKALFEGVPWDVHEKSFFITPLTLAGLILMPVWFLFPKPRLTREWIKKLFLIIYSILIIYLFVDLVSANRPFAQFLYELPILKSMRVASRLLYPLSVLISILGIYSLYKICTHILSPTPLIPFFASLLIIAGFYFGNVIAVSQLRMYSSDYTDFSELWNAVMAYNMANKSVSNIVAGYSDFQGTSGMKCRSSFFRNIKGLNVGSVNVEQNGVYNLKNPSCYVFPDENSCKPNDNISSDDTENLLKFINGQKTNWRKSVLQKFGDTISIITLILVLAFLFTCTILKMRNKWLNTLSRVES